MSRYYRIKIQGYLDAHWSDWFAGLQLTHPQAGVTQLDGTLPDQAALHGLLERIRDLNLVLLLVTGDETPLPGAADADNTGE